MIAYRIKRGELYFMPGGIVTYFQNQHEALSFAGRLGGVLERVNIVTGEIIPD